MKKLERDTMPLEAATEELLKAKTNPERKRLAAQRWTIWVPETLANDAQAEAKLQKRQARRFAKANVMQLGRWLRRTLARRAKLQQAYADLTEASSKILARCDSARNDNLSIPVKLYERQLEVLEQSRKVLDLHAKILDMAWDNIETECEKRGVKL